MSRPDRTPSANRHQRIDRFLGRCAAELERLVDHQPTLEAATALADARGRARPLPFEPSWLPVLDSIELVTGSGGDRADEEHLPGAFVGIAPDLPWIPTPRADDGGTDLALAPLNTAFDLGPTTVGVMYVGPGRAYPLHRHPPQELYLTIAGTGRWRYGGNDGFRPVEDLRTLYNRPGDLHSAVADDVPIVALYILWP